MRKKHHFQNCMRGFCYKNPRFNKKLICFRNSFQEVYKKRLPIYRKTADVVFKNTGNPGDAAEALAALLKF